MMRMAFELRPQDLEYVVESVFSDDGVRCEPAELTPASRVPSGARHHGPACGCLGWRHAHDCLPRQACRFAGSFLGMPPPDVVTGEVRDVLGEVANMIAGNLKCTLQPGLRISLPLVGETGRTF